MPQRKASGQRMSDPTADADLAAGHVVEWAKGARASLANDKLTATERARLGDLILNAATWLEVRAEKAIKADQLAKHKAFMQTIAHLPMVERMQRMSRGY